MFFRWTRNPLVRSSSTTLQLNPPTGGICIPGTTPGYRLVDLYPRYGKAMTFRRGVNPAKFPVSSVCRETPRSACMPMLIPKTNRRNMAQLCLKGTGSPKIISVFPSANEEPQGVGRNTPAFPRKGRPHKAPLTHPRVQKRNCHAGIIARCEYGAFPNDTIPAFSLSLTPCESKTRRC